MYIKCKKVDQFFLKKIFRRYLKKPSKERSVKKNEVKKVNDEKNEKNKKDG